MATVVIDLQDKRPIWSLPGWAKDRIREAVPEDWTVRFMEIPGDGSGDGVHRAPKEVLEAVTDARVYMGYGIPAEVLRAGAALEWVHSGAAGVGSSLTQEMLSRPVRFTNSAGIHGPPIAETAIAMMGFFARGFDMAVRAQREGRWGAEDFWAANAPVRELGLSTVGILGYGGIGREIGWRATALGARVLAVKRRPGGAPEPGVMGLDGLDNALAESDFFVVAAPETPETRGILDADRIGSMKNGAVLINVARGKLVDSEALLAALDEGRLRGAGLDVFHTEPLPPSHRFYSHPSVLMTPHVSATTRGFWERETELIVQNLRCFAEGMPLRNQVDKNRGY